MYFMPCCAAKHTVQYNPLTSTFLLSKACSPGWNLGSGNSPLAAQAPFSFSMRPQGLLSMQAAVDGPTT